LRDRSGVGGLRQGQVDAVNLMGAGPVFSRVFF